MKRAELERAWARVAAARRAVVHLLECRRTSRMLGAEEEARVLRAVRDELDGVQGILRPGVRSPY
jgi:hypothetical protein